MKLKGAFSYSFRPLSLPPAVPLGEFWIFASCGPSVFVGCLGLLEESQNEELWSLWVAFRTLYSAL